MVAILLISNSISMHFFVSNFKWIMLVCGLLTCTMFQGLLFPQSSFKSNFGENIEGSAVGIIVRSWSALIGLMGVMLIYGAYVSAVRKYSLIIVGLSKAIFITILLLMGRQFFGYAMGTAIIIDSIMLFLFALYLLFARSSKLT